ncbi:hypothetical protein Tco_0378459 [Tanacetum coccineum]
MAPLGQRNMKNFQLQSSFKLTVILKLPTLFFMVFHRMCMPLSIIIKLPNRYGTELSFLCKAQNCHYKKENVNCLAVPVFTHGDDLIACLNKAMAFLSAVAALRVTVQQVQGRQGQSYASTSNKDPGILDGQAAQKTIPNNVAFQTKDLDAYDSDCDDVSNAKAVLMANLSNYGSDVISEVPHSESYHNAMDNQSVHEMQDFEQTTVVYFPDNKITSDSDAVVVRLLHEVLQLPMQCT